MSWSESADRSISWAWSPNRAVRQYGFARRCATPGCGTILCSYNRAKHCYTHRPARQKALRDMGLT